MMQCGGGGVNEWRTHVLGETALHVAIGHWRLPYHRNAVSSYIYNRSIMARLDFDFRRVRLIHAPGTEFEKAGAQKTFRGKVRRIVLSADER